MAHPLDSITTSTKTDLETPAHLLEDRFRVYLRLLGDFGLSRVIPILNRDGGMFCFRLIGVDGGRKSRWSKWLDVGVIKDREKSNLNREIQLCLSDIDGSCFLDATHSALYEDPML
jgi:hypothetical protein